jgi:hypothetical protein
MRLGRWIYKMRMRVRALFRREDVDRELDDELAYHVAMKTEENMARGMNAAEARRAALIDAGGIDQAKEIAATHAAWAGYVGGALGVALAYWVDTLLVRFFAIELSVRPNGRIFACWNDEPVLTTLS